MRADFYEAGHPRSVDLHLLMEVADSPLAYDRRNKMPAYSAVGIAEAWLVNIPERVPEVFRQPRPSGYGEEMRLRPGEGIDLLAFPGCRVTVDGVLGAR